MNPALLRRLAEATDKLLGPERIVVMGSSAFLGNFPEVAALAAIETSKDADLLVSPCSENDARIAFEALGEGRAFSKKFGVHADLLRPDAAELLPIGWEARLVALDEDGVIFCLDAYDVAVAKLRAGREKDLSLLSELIKMELLDWPTLEQRLSVTPMSEKEIVVAHNRLFSLNRDHD
jgi:hypothetical protein